MTVVNSRYREPGKVAIDEAACTQCGLCARVCPTETLQMNEGRVVIREATLLGCIACAHCMMACPSGSVTVTGRGLSPADLLALPPPEERATAPALAALMRARRSIRRFSEREVAPELLDRVIEMAASAPMGIPPWEVGCVAILGREAVGELAGGIVKGYEGFLKVVKPWLLDGLRFLLPRAKYEVFRHFILPLGQMYVKSHREGRDVLLWGAPAALIFHHSAYAESTDAAIACTYAMLAAESLGLGSTMIGGAAPMLQRDKALCRKIGIPEGHKPSITLILGHPAARFQRAVKREFSHVTRVE